jgi:hypothetical protein
MILSVHLTETSPFFDPKWQLQVTNIGSLQQAELRTYDLIFSLVAQYEEDDREYSAGQQDRSKLESLIHNIDQITMQLHEVQLMLPRLRPASAEIESAATERPFWGVFSAALTAQGKSAVVDAVICIRGMLDRMPAANANDPTSSIPDPKTLAPFTYSQNKDWHESLGSDVADAVEYIIRDECGSTGAGLALFPCRMMLNVLPHGCEAYGRIVRLNAQNLLRRNLRHAEDLSELMGGLSVGSGDDFKAPECNCGAKCGTVNTHKGRMRWCGCPWVKPRSS